MTTTLTGEVGKSGRAEDVAIVQALLANIKGPDGKSFWDRRIDGRPGAELAAAIAAFQKAYVVAPCQRTRDEGVVRPGSVTWNALVSVFPQRRGELRAVPGNPLVLYATKVPAAVASDTAGRLRRGTTAPERMIGHRLRLELATAVERVATVTGVGLVLDSTALAGDRVAMRFVPGGLSVLDEYGRPRSVEGRPGDVPAVLWQAVDREMTSRSAVEATGRGAYRPRDGLQSLRSEPDSALFTRFDIGPSSVRGDKRPVLAALALIERIDRLSSDDHDELQQLFDIVAADDAGLAEALRRKRDVASRGASRQPEAVGAGPSPFEQAVDQLLRTIAGNYQSSHMAQLRALTQNVSDRIEAGERFSDLVGNRGPWDIKREFPHWVRDPVEGFEYGSDLWGNLHYGYLGKAAGFTETELILGAHWQANRDTDAWWDDPKDQAAIELGFALWDEHGFPIPRGALMDSLRRRKAELNTR